MSMYTSSSDLDDLDIFEGTILGKFHRVEAFLGEGCFGFVTKCRNLQTNKAVAIKVNKNLPVLLQQAKKEIFILDKLRCLDPDSCSIVKWNGFFMDGERICLSYELLDQSLYDYIEERHYQGLPVSELRPVLHQLANALSHLGSMGIIHADLKPENVMVVDRTQSPIKVKVINFGLARPVATVTAGDCAQTTWYRAPEVMLKAPFDQAIDMWALGLIAAELAIGQPLYPGYKEYDVFRYIIQTQGQPPDCVLERGFDPDLFFMQENCGDRRWRFKSEDEYQHETGYRAQETRYVKLECLDDLEQLMKMKTGHQNGQDLLVSLIKQMLHLDANERITPLGVFQHPFFDPSFSQSSSRDRCNDTENTEDQRPVLCQQPSSWPSESPQNIDWSVQNSADLTEQTPLNKSVDTPSFLPSDFDTFKGTMLGQCYKVEALLGEGCFGFVTKCLDTKNNKAVAIKVNKNHPKNLQQAKSEIFILEQLQCLDPDSCNIIQWNGFFIDREWICLNFELLDQSLYDYMRDQNYQGLPVSEIRPVLYQLANALSHLNSRGIVHTDLKPDNVMVVDRTQSPIKVKLIDFGLARPVSTLLPHVPVQSLWYRAPEVMLQAPFDQAIDMWALDLIAVELAVGRPLYPGEVLDRGLMTQYFFIEEKCGDRNWRFKAEEEFIHDTGIQAQRTRFIKLKNLDDIVKLMKIRTGHQNGQELLLRLIKQMLHLDTNERITPLEVLHHQFFDPDDPRDRCIDTENIEDQRPVLCQQPSSWQSESPHRTDWSVQNPPVYRNSTLSSNNDECEIQSENLNQSWQFSSRNADDFHSCFWYPPL